MKHVEWKIFPVMNTHFDNNSGMAPRTQQNKRKRTPPRNGCDPPVRGDDNGNDSSTDSDSGRATSSSKVLAISTPSQSCVMASLLTRIREDSSAARSEMVLQLLLLLLVLLLPTSDHQQIIQQAHSHLPLPNNNR